MVNVGKYTSPMDSLGFYIQKKMLTRFSDLFEFSIL